MEDHLQFLSKLDLFSSFNEKDLKLILANLKSYNFKDSEVLTKESEMGDQMFILLKGHVSVYKFNTKKKIDEKVAILGPGDVFGERTLFLGEPRSATIKTEGVGTFSSWQKKSSMIYLKNQISLKIKFKRWLKRASNFLTF